MTGTAKLAHCFLAGLLFLALFPAAPGPAFAESLEVRRLELSVRLDTRRQELYAKATLFLHNPGPGSRRNLEFRFPPALGPRVVLRAVWDRQGELPWQSGPVRENQPRSFYIRLRMPLGPAEEQVVVVTYDLELKGWTASAESISFTPDSVRLATTGWYPLPASAGSGPPVRLRLAVRLPKEWRVSAHAGLEKIREGTALSSYEVELEPVEPDKLLLRASSPPA